MDDTTIQSETFVFGPPQEEAGGILTIDLSAIEANWQMLRSRATPAECAAVVKGDAYGCGLEPVTALLSAAGCKTFFVAHLVEGKRVRALAPQADIYVLNGLPPGTTQVFADHDLRPIIGNPVELAEWDAFVGASGWRGSIAVHVDTGMNRLGFSVEEAAAIAPRLQTEHHGIALLMSHFVVSEAPQHPRNNEQILAFRELRRLFRGVPASLANSSGVFLGSSAFCDLVRPGVALYGANPTPSEPNPMRRVVELQARIIQVRKVLFGETIGYNATWTARRPSLIALIGVGYADGYHRVASASDSKPGGYVIAGGQRCPIVGRISMDIMAIDITDLPEGGARRGDLVTLIGPGLELEDVAEFFGSNSYEVLTSLGHRHSRVYRKAVT